ncbi:MAG: amidohydrolase family protein [Planctomycetota bacterium]|nr:amidohydrolase family protein [Planctomycetota bacterium]
MNEAMSITDVSAWVGAYPFRGIHRSSFDDLEAKAEELGIGRIVVSSFENLFWENNLDGFNLWWQRLTGRNRFEHWPVINPAMPGQIKRLKELIEEAQPRGLRLLPNYHGYQLSDPCLENLMGLVKDHGLVVQVFQRIADERWHWMLHTPAVEDSDIVSFVRNYPEHHILISAMNQPNILVEYLADCPHLYVDVSRVRGPVFAVEQMLGNLPANKVVFGSLWPVQIIEATLWQVQEARISEKTRKAVLHENFEALVGSEA